MSDTAQETLDIIRDLLKVEEREIIPEIMKLKALNINQKRLLNECYKIYGIKYKELDK